MNFVKAIVENKVDDFCHNTFVRYGPGTFEKEEFKIKATKKNIKIWAGFEYVNVMQKFAAKHAKGTVHLSGHIQTPRDISGLLQELELDYEEGSKRGMRGMKFILYKIDADISAKNVQRLFDELDEFCLMFDFKNEETGMNIKISKKALPKIGASTPKFVVSQFPVDMKQAIIDEFLFDVKDEAENSDLKEVLLHHTYNITEIKVDEKLLQEDAAAARKKAIRCGTLDRKISFNGDEQIVKEYPMSV